MGGFDLACGSSLADTLWHSAHISENPTNCIHALIDHQIWPPFLGSSSQQRTSCLHIYEHYLITKDEKLDAKKSVALS